MKEMAHAARNHTLLVAETSPLSHKTNSLLKFLSPSLTKSGMQQILYATNKHTLLCNIPSPSILHQ